MLVNLNPIPPGWCRRWAAGALARSRQAPAMALALVALSTGSWMLASFFGLVGEFFLWIGVFRVLSAFWTQQHLGVRNPIRGIVSAATQTPWSLVIHSTIGEDVVRSVFVLLALCMYPDAWAVALPAAPWTHPNLSWATHVSYVLLLGLVMLILSPMRLVAPSALAAQPDMTGRTFAITKLLYSHLFTPPFSREWAPVFAVFLGCGLALSALSQEAPQSGLLWGLVLLIGGTLIAFGLAFFFEGARELTGMGPPRPVQQTRQARVSSPGLSAANLSS